MTNYPDPIALDLAVAQVEACPARDPRIEAPRAALQPAPRPRKGRQFFADV